MIEINLLPGSVKRAPKRGVPRIGGGGGGGGAFDKLRGLRVDRGLAILAGVWVAAIALVAWMHFSSTSALAELQARETAAIADSTRYAAMKLQGEDLRAKEAVIAQKMDVIQTIDAGRYIWAHVLDEVSRALPSYVWITNMTEAFNEAGLPRVRISGRAGNFYAISRYLEDLENSPFLHQIRLVSADREQVDERMVLSFVLEAGYQEPPPDVIQTVPLFAAGTEN